MPTAQAQAEVTYAAYSAYVRSSAMPCPYSRLHTTFLEYNGELDVAETVDGRCDGSMSSSR